MSGDYPDWQNIRLIGYKRFDELCLEADKASSTTSHGRKPVPPDTSTPNNSSILSSRRVPMPTPLRPDPDTTQPLPPSHANQQSYGKSQGHSSQVKTPRPANTDEYWAAWRRQHYTDFQGLPGDQQSGVTTQQRSASPLPSAPSLARAAPVLDHTTFCAAHNMRPPAPKPSGNLGAGVQAIQRADRGPPINGGRGESPIFPDSSTYYMLGYQGKAPHSSPSIAQARPTSAWSTSSTSSTSSQPAGTGDASRKGKSVKRVGQKIKRVMQYF